jgi:hypothetical protein
MQDARRNVYDDRNEGGKPERDPGPLERSPPRRARREAGTDPRAAVVGPPR